VEGVVGEALARVLGEERRLSVAGRTDAGVHARGQVASHAGHAARAAALNGVLPPDVRVIRSAEAPDGFDARRDAKSRTYRYRVLAAPEGSVFERNRALHWKHPTDRAALRACAERTQGTHDFTAFTPTQTAHRRFERQVLRADWVEGSDGALEFWIEADSFMRHMVRTLVGTMLGVAAGRTTVDEFALLLEGRPRSAAGDMVAAHGLYLESVRY
jgi:tRNA pseudouridine38-40 synthase